MKLQRLLRRTLLLIATPLLGQLHSQARGRLHSPDRGQLQHGGGRSG